MEAKITPSFIDAFVEYDRQMKEEFDKKMVSTLGEDSLKRLENTVFVETSKEAWEEQWAAQVRNLYSGFKKVHPDYKVDEKTFGLALVYHPKGRNIMILL